MGQNVPPRIRQSLADSCWAAVLQSWSQADPRMPQGLVQQDLIARWGEGMTGGIDPLVKIPQIAQAYGLRLPQDSQFRYITTYLERYLGSSYIFCASPVPQSVYMHAVLIYDMNTRDNEILTMDPDRGRLHRWNTTEFLNLGIHVVMHRP